MPDFRFDEGKTFAQNCEAFLEAIKADDPEMAAKGNGIRKRAANSMSGSRRRWTLMLLDPLTPMTVHDAALFPHTVGR